MNVSKIVLNAGNVFLLLFVFSTFSPPHYAAEKTNDEFGQSEREETKLLRLAQTLFREQKFPAAAKHFRQFLKRYSKDPRTPQAGMMLAECFYQQALTEVSFQEKPSDKIFQKAKDEYKKVLRSTPRGDLLGESAAFRIGEIEFNLKDYDAALNTFKKDAG